NEIDASADNTGSYSWTIPNDISTTVKVKISDVNDSASYDTSSNNFKIRGSLRITAPNGAESWIVDSSENITWVRNGSIATVKLEYSTDGGTTYDLIDSSITATDLSYAWTIPDDISSAVRVKITNEADSTIFDASDSDFAIKGSLALTSPNGAEVWVVSDAEAITWTYTGSIANVKLDYSTNAGLTYPNPIIAQTPCDGAHGWTIPDDISETVKVRISDFTDDTVN
ncbi:unnamed protein product, partial [marine sediment metagenome]